MVNIAKETIKSCYLAGADYIKLKKKNVQNYYQKGKQWRKYDFKTYRQSLELSEEDFKTIDIYCGILRIPWFSTVHDKENLLFISKFNPPFYKVASMDAKNPEFLSWFVDTVPSNKPVIVSTGGMGLGEIEDVVKLVTDHKLSLILNHCVSIYPTPLEQTNIGMIATLRTKFASSSVKIGYSGHEEGWGPTLMAVILGAEFIERHVTLSRDLKIHHIEAGLTTNEFKSMINDVRNIETLNQLLKTGWNEYNLEELDFLLNKNYV